QVVRPIDFVLLTVYMDSGHGCTFFLPGLRVLIMESSESRLDSRLVRRGKCRGNIPTGLSMLSGLAELGFRASSARCRIYPRLELLTDALDRTAQRLHRTGGVGAEGRARPERRHQARQDLRVLGTAPATLQGAKSLHAPGQSIPAGRTPAAGFPSEEFFHVAQQRGHV